MEEQHSTCCPCGSCSLFDRDQPREASSAQQDQEQSNGCVLFSRWLPDEIDDYSRHELFQEFTKQHGTVDFTYSSAKVGLEVNKYGISSNNCPTSFPGSSLYFEKVPWLRQVTCLCMSTQAVQRVGPRLNFVITV